MTEPTPGSPSRLQRSRHDRMFAGVCGGIGEYFHVDPTVVRLAFVLAAFLGGVGVLAYLALLVVMPEEGTAATSPTVSIPSPERGRELVGVALVILGGLYLLNNSGLLRINWNLIWPAALILLGVALLLRRGR